MKTTAINLHGRVYHMPSNLGVLRDINQRVGDPFVFMASSLKGDKPLSQVQCIDLLTIGIVQAGCTDSENDIGNELMKRGYAALLPLSIEYLLAIVGGDQVSTPARPKPVAAPKSRRR